MSVLDWSFVSLLAAALLFLFFGLFFLFFWGRTRGRMKKLSGRRPPKNKKKRKRWKRQQKELRAQYSRQCTGWIVLLVLALLAGGGSFYTRYYQQYHLQAEDSEAIVQSYYLLEELVVQLQELEAGTTPQKSFKNIHELSGRLGSYGARKAYQGLTEDNQKLLNRYFVQLRELGVNLNGQRVETLQATEAIQGYLTDIEKAEESQTKVFKQFKVNEAALKKNQ
ncbi:hypothetical protein IW492_07795 [Enterococcus sp. BWB1-3]|uniref:hypothetical protein n=1 Tax=unclassified Enterococcus TaxID=2608891 RepID=UPI001920F7AE|nr:MULTISPECIES: hypothetical protein [unclassified Enterococcus]MBL1229135.1 hypothetical protein [Enterococcus sp. BWB1-3]MCB5952515.1 hypothetical protein [Enterococcus sp. BWT-B8]MCB5953444.1 hypothetical protein [Enterococcus sp. CWB-B31]